MEGENLKTELLQVARDIANGVGMASSDARVCREGVERITQLEEQLRGAWRETARVAQGWPHEGFKAIDALPTSWREGALSLKSEGDDAVVSVERAPGVFVEVIRTYWPCDGMVSHIVEAAGIDQCFREKAPQVDIKERLRAAHAKDLSAAIEGGYDSDPIFTDARARIEALENEVTNLRSELHHSEPPLPG